MRQVVSNQGSTVSTSLYEFELPVFSGNAPPTVSIVSPATSGMGFDVGEAITFAATASDPEDGDLAASLSWTSNRDGALGQGDTIVVSSLSIGTHTVSASVVDSGGETTVDSTVVTVSPPGVISLSAQIAQSTDDAEQRGDSDNVWVNSNDIELVRDGVAQTVGLRFSDLSVPQGAIITRAYVQFQTKTVRPGPTVALLVSPNRRLICRPSCRR